MEEDTSNFTTTEAEEITETENTPIFQQSVTNFRLDETYLLCYCVLIIGINLFFMYVILRNNLNRSPFYLTLLHISIYATLYTACGVLATLSFGIPNYGYHIFMNSKHIAISFETILITVFIFDWFIKSEYHSRNIITGFWTVTISYIFLSCIAISCDDRLFYSFYILTFITFTILLATVIIAIIVKCKKIINDEKRRNRLLLVFTYVLCFLPKYLLLIFNIHLYYFDIVDFFCPILMYGYSLINIVLVISLDNYFRLHFRKVCRQAKTYQQNSHFPVETV